MYKEIKDSANKDIKINYKHGIKAATLNCRGLNVKTKRELIIDIMADLQLDILMLQETHVNTNSMSCTDGYTFIYSSSITDKARDAFDKAVEKNSKNKKWLYHKQAEKAGVGVVISPHFLKYIKDFEQVNGRLMSIHLKHAAREMVIINAYMPQSGINEDEKDDAYEDLSKVVSQYRAQTIKVICGDFNARLRTRQEGEEDVLGPRTMGACPLSGRALRHDCCRLGCCRLLWSSFPQKPRGCASDFPALSEHAAHAHVRKQGSTSHVHFPRLQGWLKGRDHSALTSNCLLFGIQEIGTGDHQHGTYAFCDLSADEDGQAETGTKNARYDADQKSDRISNSAMQHEESIPTWQQKHPRLPRRPACWRPARRPRQRTAPR